MSEAWHLLADIGGTNARFALGALGSGELRELLTVSVADHPTFASALQTYLDHLRGRGGWAERPVDGCLAVAAPAHRQVVTFTNSDWVIDRRDIALSLGINRLSVINDFAAQGYACAGLSDGDWRQVGAGSPVQDAVIGVLGPGTGLGVCAVVPLPGGHRVLAGEGGHVDFPPVGEEEVEILRILQRRYRRVSAERVLSGAGLQNLYWALTQMRGAKDRHATPADISAAALAATDPVAVEALHVFCRVLGSVAGNLALTYGAFGGMYIGGGIVPRIADFLAASDFRERFLAKGRFRDYLNDIPTRIVTRDNPGLYGALRFLESRDAT
jgi:glucokinase